MNHLPLHLCFVLFGLPLLHANEALQLLEKQRELPTYLPPVEAPASAAPIDPSIVPPEKIIHLPQEWAGSPPDALWQYTTLYNDPGNPCFQQFAITGYYDFQASFGDAETDASATTQRRTTALDGTRSRRTRLGARLKAFHNTEIEGNVEFAGDAQYRGIERLVAHTAINPHNSISFGKFRPSFGAENNIEPQFSPFPDRSHLANILGPNPSVGVMLHHLGNKHDYSLGWFSSNYHPDLATPQSGGFLNFRMSGAITEMNGPTTMKTRWNFDYIHNFDPATATSIPSSNLVGKFSANGNQLVTNPAYRHLFNIGINSQSDDFDFLGDFFFAKGDRQSAWGVTIAPSYWLIPGTLKLVGRYHYAGSNEPGGITTSLGTSNQSLYDSSSLFIGDELHSFYLGANLHLYKDRLVLNNGIEHVIINDDKGGKFNTESTTFQTGAKLSF